MAVFRVPIPDDPEQRRTLFERAAARLSGHGRYEGTPEAGLFEGHTPIGRFAGAYRVVAQDNELEVEIHKKPFFVPLALIESEARKFLTSA
jgi:hypothetical protein